MQHLVNILILFNDSIQEIGNEMRSLNEGDFGGHGASYEEDNGEKGGVDACVPSTAK